MGDGLGAPVRAKLGVQVAHMGLDGVGRDVEFVRDFGCRQVSREVAQDPNLASAERLQRRLRPG
jgi:hypothetical protein